MKHDDAALLETYDSTPMILERKLDTPIKVPSYGSQADAMQSKAVGTIPMSVGTSCSVLFGEPSPSTLPSTVAAGDVFFGKVTYLSNPSNVMGCGTRPGGYPVTFFCTGAKAPKPIETPPAQASVTASGADKKEATEEGEAKVSEDKPSAPAVFEMCDTLRNAIRDANLKFLSGLGEKDVPKDMLNKELSQHPFRVAYAHMVGEYPGNVSLRLTGLDYVMKCLIDCVGTDDVSVNKRQYLDAVIGSSDEIFDMIDRVAIMTEFGVLIDASDASASKKRKEISEIKEQVRMNSISYTSYYVMSFDLHYI